MRWKEWTKDPEMKWKIDEYINCLSRKKTVNKQYFGLFLYCFLKIVHLFFGSPTDLGLSWGGTRRPLGLNMVPVSWYKAGTFVPGLYLWHFWCFVMTESDQCVWSPSTWQRFHLEVGDTLFNLHCLYSLVHCPHVQFIDHTIDHTMTNRGLSRQINSVFRLDVETETFGQWQTLRHHRPLSASKWLLFCFFWKGSV